MAEEKIIYSALLHSDLSVAAARLRSDLSVAAACLHSDLSVAATRPLLQRRALSDGVKGRSCT